MRTEQMEGVVRQETASINIARLRSGQFAKAARIKSIVGSIFSEKTVVGACGQSRAFEIDRPIIGLMS
jgi:hypothetical protein